MALVPDTSNFEFVYPTLDHEERQIRVVTVDHVDTTGTLKCTLGTISLNSPPVYVALSYVWGTDHANNIILVNGLEFKVRKNLYDFVTTVQTERLLGVPVFVDAICINQANTQERESQVSLMRDVYSCASEVIAWLGSHVVMFGIRMEMNNELMLAIVAKMLEPILRNAQKSLRINNTQDQGKKHALEELDSAEAGPLNYVLLSPFWSRLWIVQEAISAKSLVLQLGDHSIRLERLSGFLTAFRSFYGWKDDDHDTNELPFMTPHSNVRTIRAFRNIRAAENIIKMRLYTAPRQLPLYELLINWCTQECTEPRDIVFGLLGMSKSRIVVQYNISMTQLFLNVLIEGLFDISEATREDTTNRQQIIQWQFYEACVAAFSYSRTNTTVLCIVQNAMQRSGMLDEDFFGSWWKRSYAAMGIAMDNWPKSMHFLMSQYATIETLLFSGVRMRPSSRYHEMLAGVLYAIQVYKVRNARSSNRTMLMPDGEACSYSEWIARINETADFLKGHGPRPRDLDNSNQDECARECRRQMQFQKILEVGIQLFFAVVVVSIGVLLGSPLKTTFTSLTSLMMRDAAQRYPSRTTFETTPLQNEEL